MEFNLTKEEAIQLLEDGKKVAHRFFSDGEWIKKHNERSYIFEDGIICSKDMFWIDRSGNSFKICWGEVKDEDPKNIINPLDFNPDKWEFERSSGYAGYRHIINNDWIYENDYIKRLNWKNEFINKMNFLNEFRKECLSFGEYPDVVLNDFLIKYFNK